MKNKNIKPSKSIESKEYGGSEKNPQMVHVSTDEGQAKTEPEELLPQHTQTETDALPSKELHVGIEEIVNVPTTSTDLTVSFETLIPSIAKVTSRSGEQGVLTIVKTASNGNRLIVASEIHQALGEPKSIQVGFTDGKAVLAECLGEEYTDYSLRKQGAKSVIYNKELVEQFVEHFQLDFNERTSITLRSVTYQDWQGQQAAVIS